MLTQRHDERKEVIKCYRKIHLKQEIHYYISKKELLAIINAVDHFYKCLYVRSSSRRIMLCWNS